MCDTCAKLREENAELAKALDSAVVIEPGIAPILGKRMGMTRVQAQIVSTLYQARRPVTIRSLEDHVEKVWRKPWHPKHKPDDWGSSSLRVQMYHLRNNYGKDWIGFASGFGYYLSDEARERVAAELEKEGA